MHAPLKDVNNEIYGNGEGVKRVLRKGDKYRIASQKSPKIKDVNRFCFLTSISKHFQFVHFIY